MRNLIFLSTVLFYGNLIFSQTFEPFNFSGALNANGWTSHSGSTSGQFQADNAGSLTYPNLAASVGNKVNYVAGNGEDVNKAISGISGTGYFSFLLNVPNITGLTTTGDYFSGFASTAGNSVTNFAGRVFIKAGLTANTFVLGIQNTTGGTPTQTYTSTEYPIGSTIFVVVKLNASISPIQASIFVNPIPGSSEPASTFSNNSGTASTFTTFASIFLRQAGTSAAGTGNIQLDEIRVGTTWESVTPPCVSPTTYFADTDGDSYGDPNSSIQACSLPSGYVLDNTDCNDKNASINPNTIWYVDSDGDGFGSSTSTKTFCTQPSGYVDDSSDCDDASNLINPNTEWYEDADGDGFGNPSKVKKSCTQPNNYVSNSTDCDDSNASINPNTIWYADADGDGFGNVNSTQSSCNQPSGYVSNSTDCNDNDANNNALATYYQDADQDGFGNLSVSQSSCGQPSGYVTNSTDCDDNNASVNVVTTWYQDNDGDGFGSSVSMQNCGQPNGYVSQTGDCDDNSNSINPNAQEVCDGIDNNCDGQVDNGLTFNNYYEDVDGDTFGNPNSSLSDCSQPTGYVLDNTDCNDANASVNPNAQDISGNSIDENCDGVDGNVGIQEVLDMKLYVSPNPNEGSFLIQLNQIVNNAEINLTDLNGKVIQVHRFHGDSIQITENNLEKGFYLVQVSFNENKLVQRIMIQ